MASAVALIRFSSMLQPNRFQLFQPMTGAVSGPGWGVAAAAAGDVTVTTIGMDAVRASPRVVAAAVRARFSVPRGRIIAAPRQYEIESVEYCCTPLTTDAQARSS